MASTMRFDNWETTNGTSIATTNASGDITFAGAVSGSGKILQVVSTTKTDTFTASVAAYGGSADVTGLSVSITPSSTSSTIYLAGMVYGNAQTLLFMGIDVTRNGTNIIAPTSPGNRAQALGAGRQEVNATSGGQYGIANVPIAMIDSPASTSAQTYQVRVRNLADGARTMYVNRTVDDSDSGGRARSISTIIAMEVAG